MAHIEFTANGVLMVAFGLLLPELQLGARSLTAWFVTLQLGTWFNGLAGVIGAFIGYSSKLMTTINEKFPAPKGLDHPLTTASLMLCGIAIMACLVLTLVGLTQRRR
jgi:hypothetical protein